ncbi:hypothetical protein DL240_02780 [Lujinxingia litoralis]|uniref:Phosphoglycerate mutase family protein n=1 Tax=Lujinxingia litoralis TaxID=2211119 RepID=A0A328CAJ3_9DELT|nr:nucleotidyltransferase domain-containing protein [Lujinxingia litoralis]RAL25152.1 hypothetical protein DL240_02780 [Lujinxingia litoralis]
MHDILELANANQQKARQIIETTGVVDAWKSIGADVHLVGSLKTGLLMKHRDIDFHIYTSDLDIAESFQVMGQLAAHPGILRAEWVDGSHSDEHCLEWHAWYRDEEGREWQLDMIQILRGSTYEGYFERVAERINAVLTPETRQVILALKYATPDSESIAGIEYYQAVLRDGVRTWSEFVAWRQAHPLTGVVEWCP